MPRRPTMNDVAAVAGVSLKTVSRVVNGEDHVSEDLRRRVHRAVEELDYRVDDRAQRLRRRDASTATLGFVLDDVSNDFFSAILRGLEDVARERDALVLSGSTDGDADREQALVDAFVRRRVDALVVVTSAGSEALRAEIRRGTPVVLVDLEPPELLADVVRSDHRAGGLLATSHLLAHGHDRIAFLGDGQGVFSAEERFRGHVEALGRAGLEPDPDLVLRRRLDARGWALLAGTLLDRDRRPSAVFAAQNFVAMGVVMALHERGLQREVAVVGHDDVPLAEVVEPGVTTVPQRPRELGRIAAERVFARLDGDVGPPGRHLLEPRLVARGSGELAPLGGRA